MRPFPLLAVFFFSCLRAVAGDETIPLPEHPRPDFQRDRWLNLNGSWDFRSDKQDRGLTEGWAKSPVDFSKKIVVPFPWGSPLSGVANEADIAWYHRAIRVPPEWRGQRIFLVVGACDWKTSGWLDGHALGEHQGGYTPFEFELTDIVNWDHPQQLVMRVDDTPHPFKLEGKQGYGDVKGIWQTVYLEARPATYLKSVHLTPDLVHGRATLHARLSSALSAPARITLKFTAHDADDVTVTARPGSAEVEIVAPLAHPHPWSPDDPYLYQTDVTLETAAGTDQVHTYFGLRSIGVTTLPGTDFSYLALNGRPFYLQATLDQSYNAGGYYTFPSDAFMRDEILRSKRLGLNANRVHIKVEVPRKLYWADKLGLLIMADVPNFWGEPTPEAQQESETAMRGMIERDFNHPAIFSWVLFNETWGLFTGQGAARSYLPSTQEWVRSMYHQAKALDSTRLVEDNSACNHDHVETDVNSWHDYLPGYAWREHLDAITRDTHPGSTWNFFGGRTQSNQPMFNSECGNVWGYEGSTGDVDWSWDYHAMMNEFRRHPKVAGWLYTEHHDVINEWNGYYRFDRSEKFTGLGEIVPGMSIADLHQPFYVSTGSELCRDAHPGETVAVPLFASFLTDQAPAGDLQLEAALSGWNDRGESEEYSSQRIAIPFVPWMTRDLAPLQIAMPYHRALALLTLTLHDASGAVRQRNFTTFLVSDGAAPRDEPFQAGGISWRALRFAPATFQDATWSLKKWTVLDGLKVNGAGHGHFEYRIPWPHDLAPGGIAHARLRFEASAKRLLGKDREGTLKDSGDYMRGQGAHDPGANPNSYPMTDTHLFPSAVRVRINGVDAGVYSLPNDPADHRGILSWHAQLRDGKLREAGSYGYPIDAPLPSAAIDAAASAGEIVIRFEVDGEGGLALYGERFGRYPLDPTLLFELTPAPPNASR
ncbi:MAG TPA: glycoside hydrolase family 2 TIM barrel-domain containing protein [Candidatus Didemnitutus sp.]|nr:glycoside hydrolase family 2 TIM barrel-domain containing protein [Candidatus Didemnitutus sp.]